VVHEEVYEDYDQDKDDGCDNGYEGVEMFFEETGFVLF
jgi:hypothetical protein